MAAIETSKRFESLRFGTLLVLLTACFLFGGASRTDVLSLVLLQPLAVACAALFLWTPGPIHWTSVRVPLLLLGALAAIMAIQLVPLPPSVWTTLPGREPLMSGAEVAGIDQPWREISLTPDLTLSSLVGLVTPLAVLIGFAGIPVERRRALLPYLILMVALSTLVGLAQIGGGPDSPFYFYDITNSDSPVGFFSNRNHQAVFLAIGWPMLAVWATLPAEGPYFATKGWMAFAAAILLLPMVMVIGSRAGLFLGAAGMMIAFLIWRTRQAAAPPSNRWSVLLIPTAFFAALCAIGATIALSRDDALQRMAGVTFDDEARLQYLPTLLEIVRDFFPVGAGFGSFDQVFRMYEPAEFLKPTYLNHAHNDLVELAISGGLPAILLLLAFLTWLSVRTIAVLRDRSLGQSLVFARLGWAMIAIILASSLVDYPLRTPLMAALFAVACGWLSIYDPKPARGTSTG